MRKTTQTKKPRRGGKVAVPPKPTYSMVRITQDLIDRIDEVRPEQLPREPFIRYVLDIGLKQLEEEG